VSKFVLAKVRELVLDALFLGLGRMEGKREEGRRRKEGGGRREEEGRRREEEGKIYREDAFLKGDGIIDGGKTFQNNHVPEFFARNFSGVISTSLEDIFTFLEGD
jgi:hypothetical protein